MARYRILKDFNGSQDGRFTEAFKAGTEADLSDYLVSCLPADSIQPVEEDAAPAATISTGRKSRKTAVSPAPTSGAGTTTGKE